jgi:hypothetical protein
LFPHAPQLSIVLSAVSQPSRSGAVVVQLPKPVLHAEYVHDNPVGHAAPMLLVVSHALPHPAQFVADVGVSHPLRLAPLLSQSRKPALHDP